MINKNPRLYIGIRVGIVISNRLLVLLLIVNDYAKATVSPAITMLTIDISLIRILSEGPLVSLNGSPTVSPTMKSAPKVRIIYEKRKLLEDIFLRRA